MKRPWNIISPPVYSLATVDEVGKLNMNICTYVSAVSMKPKMYSIAVDYDTKTYKNIKSNDKAVLQLLSTSNLRVIRKLGKTSGFSSDKSRYLTSFGLIEQWRGFDVLKGASALIELNKKQIIDFEGDHAIFLFEVIKFKTISENNVLSFQHLVDNKLIL